MTTFDQLGDWRIQAATTLAKDIEPAYPGGPSHKAGAPVYLTTLGADRNAKPISFYTPSPVALALGIAIRSGSSAVAKLNDLSFTHVATPVGTGTSITAEALPHLYDYFELCLVAIVFSFLALETFCNEIIEKHLSGTFALTRKNGSTNCSAQELQRQATTEEKLATILPKLLNIQSPKGKKAWPEFKNLKDRRDTAIHLKAHDAYPRVSGNFQIESFFVQLLNEDVRRYPKSAFEMIKYFTEKGPEARWLRLTKEHLDRMLNQPNA